MNRNDHSQFDEIADRFVCELREGLNPQIADYARCHPEIAERIEKLFPVLRRMETPADPDAIDESEMMARELQQIADIPPLRQLGDYRIIREIGRGGMGIVYEAEQESLGRNVALKVLPETIQFDERRRQRFHQEARTAAMLHHTNIIPVFGVGHCDQLSYFVMQYIDGKPLDAVLRELSDAAVREGQSWSLDGTHGGQAALSTEASHLLSDRGASQPVAHPPHEHPDPAGASPSRPNASRSSSGSDPGIQLSQTLSHDHASGYWRNVARLGQQVASALAHAHSAGILHRDIKPSNLLLDEHGSVWVADFGLAKYLESPDLTRTGEFVGTLRYMSPEQLNGKTDERSDIFSLGLTLYELAALRPAFDAVDRKALVHQVGEGVIVSVRSANRQVPRDLATIIDTCLAVDPDKRYASAAALESDLGRFLMGEPILARRTPVLERAVKWCQRRPAVAALLGALLVSLALGFAGIAWQWQRTAAALELAEDNLQTAQTQTEVAKKHFTEAREAVNRYFTIVSQQRLLREPGLLPLRQELLEEALRYHRAFAEQYRDDDEVKAELAASLYHIAEIEGQIAASPDLDQLVDQPLQLFQELAEANPDNPEYAVWISRCQSLRGQLLRRKDVRAFVQLLTTSASTLQTAREDFNDPLLGAEQLANHYQQLGLYWESVGRATHETEKSLDYFGRALAERLALHDAQPDDVHQTIQIASLKRDLGITYRRRGEFDEAVRLYDEAIALLRTAVADHPENRIARGTLASVSNSIGFYYGTGAPEKDYTRALECYRESAAQYEVLMRQNPLIIEYQEGLARALQNVGDVLHAADNLDEALEAQKQSMTIRERLTLNHPEAVYLASSLAITMNGIGSTLRDMGQLDESLEWHDRAHEQHRRAVQADPADAMFRIRLVDGLIQQARTRCAQMQFETAVEALEKIEDFTLPNYAEPHFRLGRDLMIVACKIGCLDDDERTPERESLRERCLDQCKTALQLAKQAGQDVARSWQIDGAVQNFSQYVDCQEISQWIESGGLE